jgi:hypothetical protein
VSPYYRELPVFQWYCEQKLQIPPQQIVKRRIRDLVIMLKAQNIPVPYTLTNYFPIGWEHQFPEIKTLLTTSSTVTRPAVPIPPPSASAAVAAAAAAATVPAVNSGSLYAEDVQNGIVQQHLNQLSLRRSRRRRVPKPVPPADYGYEYPDETQLEAEAEAEAEPEPAPEPEPEQHQPPSHDYHYPSTKQYRRRRHRTEGGR